MKLNKLCAALVCAGCITPGLAFATNGMNMEGYGPIATAMGGASMAYNNGTAAMMNNPATLALMPQGKQIDLAFGYLGPDITSSMNGMDAKSLADSFYMPAFGWVTKKDKFTYGLGIYGQGGMGTEYAGSSFMSAGSGQIARSELGVGRVLFPLAMEVSPNFTVGGTFDIVWAQMDLQMPMEATQIGAMQGLGLVDFSGGLASALGGMGAGDVAYINFSDNNRFTGKAKAAGYAGKIGFTYKASSKLSLGATYHSKTRLSDMEANGASLSIISGGATVMGMDGTMTVKNFQWPSTFGLGMAYQSSDKLMLAMDYKRIGWKSVMQDFQMTFVDAASGGDLNITFNQNWEDQNVLMMGLSHKTTKALTLRAGVNLANNPVPDYYMNALFPAIEKTHATAGLGYAFSKASTVDFALSHAFTVTSTNAMDQSVSHSQTNWQFIYSYRF
jgi:long-chain fatty acid transport protein